MLYNITYRTSTSQQPQETLVNIPAIRDRNGLRDAEEQIKLLTGSESVEILFFMTVQKAELPPMLKQLAKQQAEQQKTSCENWESLAKTYVYGSREYYFCRAMSALQKKFHNETINTKF